jgi:hypothetical protein
MILLGFVPKLGNPRNVIPAQAGIQNHRNSYVHLWIPVCTGMTGLHLLPKLGTKPFIKSVHIDFQHTFGPCPASLLGSI